MNRHAQTRSFITILLAVLLLLSITALACNMQQTPVPPTATPSPQACREPVGIPLATSAVPTTAVAFQTVIGDFLNQGGDPSDLEFALRNWGVIDDETGGHVIADRDFNNDGYYDVLVTLHYPSQTTVSQQPGQLLLFGCEGPTGNYSIFYSFASAPGSAQHMPQVQTPIVDITADGLVDLLFLVEECTSLACFREPIIMTWDTRAGNMRALSEPFEGMYFYTDDRGDPIRGVPSASFELFSTAKDQPLNFIIQEGHIEAREAGPHRPARYTWYWHGYQYLHTPPEYAPSLYMIHAVRDADQIFAEARYGEAATSYTAIINEDQPTGSTDASGAELRYPNLIGWGGILPKDENISLEEERLKAYARYRLLLSYAVQRRTQEAQSVLTGMQQEHPWQLDNVASYYTLLATNFWDVFVNAGVDTATDDGRVQNVLAAACQVVQETAANQYPSTYEFLGDKTYFGPSPGEYTVVDLCPFYAPPEEAE